MYNVALDLSQEQKKQLRLLAVSRGQSVKSLITELAIREIQSENQKKKKEGVTK